VYAFGVGTVEDVRIETTAADGKARTLDAALARPPETPDEPSVDRRAGVILLHEAFGLNDDLRRIAARFADHGYVAVAPDFVGRGAPKPICIARFFRGLGEVGTGQPYRDLAAAREWLAGRPDVDGERIGLAGFCVGGGFAILHAAHAHDMQVIAPFYAHLPHDLDDLRGICPVVASYGGRDGSLRGAGDRLAAALRELGVAHDVRTYAEAGHSFMNRRSGLTGWIGSVSPMHAGYVESAAEDAWRRMLDFFALHLSAGTARSQAGADDRAARTTF
jgi:carboxymethylenebutenolidase